MAALGESLLGVEEVDRVPQIEPVLRVVPSAAAMRAAISAVIATWPFLRALMCLQVIPQASAKAAIEIFAAADRAHSGFRPASRRPAVIAKKAAQKVMLAELCVPHLVPMLVDQGNALTQQQTMLTDRTGEAV